MKLQPKTIQAISQQMYQRFPEIAGISPRVQMRPASKALSGATEPTYLVIYEKPARTAQGGVINRSVRVIVNQSGQILRVSTSR